MSKALLYTVTLLAMGSSSVISSELSDLNGIIEGWAEDHCKSNGLKFRWVELYKGTTKHPNKLFARVITTDYEHNVEMNNKTQSIGEGHVFHDNRSSQSETKSKVARTFENNTSYSITVTKGLDIGLPISVMAGYPPFATASATLNPSFSWNKTNQTLGEKKDTLTFDEEVIIPARTARHAKVSFLQETFDVPLTGEIEISGSVVCCFRSPLFNHPRQGKTPKYSLQEMSEGQGISLESAALPYDSTEKVIEGVLENLENKYPHFPDLERSTLKEIQQEIEREYPDFSDLRQSTFERIEGEDLQSIQLLEQGIERSSEKRAKPAPKPRPEYPFWKWITHYKFEAFPIKTIIKEFFEKYPEHPDKEYYNYSIEGDRILFKTKGFLTAAAERIIVNNLVINDYTVENYPLDQFSGEDLKKIDDSKQYEKKLDRA